MVWGRRIKQDGGEGGIRTHGGLQTLDGFQDRYIRPLCHLSKQSFEARIILEDFALVKPIFEIFNNTTASL